MRELFQRRAVLITGKGGVGKTAVAAALGHFGARQGKRVLVAEVSYDPDAVSPLGRALGVPRLSEDPARVAPNLDAVLLTPSAGHARFLRETVPVGPLADVALKMAAVRRFLLAAPTLAEMGVLYRILDLVRARRHDGSPTYDTLVVDLPATGHALGLAQIPEAILQVIKSGPIATAVREGLDLLRDAGRTASVVVTLPETLPVSEATELVAGIRKHRIPIWGAVLNRMPKDPFAPGERAAIEPFLGDLALLGARTLPRLDRAKAAVERLGALGLPLAFLGELPERGAISAQLASDLEGRSA